jgi:hypothetical protein
MPGKNMTWNAVLYGYIGDASPAPAPLPGFAIIGKPGEIRYASCFAADDAP